MAKITRAMRLDRDVEMHRASVQMLATLRMVDKFLPYMNANPHLVFQVKEAIKRYVAADNMLDNAKE